MSKTFFLRAVWRVHFVSAPALRTHFRNCANVESKHDDEDTRTRIRRTACVINIIRCIRDGHTGCVGGVVRLDRGFPYRVFGEHVSHHQTHKSQRASTPNRPTYPPVGVSHKFVCFGCKNFVLLSAPRVRSGPAIKRGSGRAGLQWLGGPELCLTINWRRMFCAMLSTMRTNGYELGVLVFISVGVL